MPLFPSFKQSSKGKAYATMFKGMKGNGYDHLRWHMATTGKLQDKPPMITTSSSTKRSSEDSTKPRERSGSQDRSDKKKTTFNTKKR